LRIEVILQVLEAKQAIVARDAIEQPAADPFGHGRSVGLYAGLSLAKDALMEFYNEKEQQTNRY
jgi:hypothetical protein